MPILLVVTKRYCTKVDGSRHGDNPLLRPTGIQMAPTNIKTVHQTSLLHIESSLDRLGLLSPIPDQRSQQQSGQVTLQPVLINKSKFLKATHRTKIRKNQIPRSMVVVETLSWWSRRASQHPAIQIMPGRNSPLCCTLTDINHHKIRLHGRRGKGTAESFSREK